MSTQKNDDNLQLSVQRMIVSGFCSLMAVYNNNMMALVTILQTL